MKTKLTLSIEVEFDGEQTVAESLASAVDRLKTALSMPGVLDEFGNPHFGEFYVEALELRRNQFEKQLGSEGSCPRNRAGHAPDWASAHIEFDGDAYVDVICRHCGRSGCIGPEKAVASGTSW